MSIQWEQFTNVIVITLPVESLRTSAWLKVARFPRREEGSVYDSSLPEHFEGVDNEFKAGFRYHNLDNRTNVWRPKNGGDIYLSRETREVYNRNVHNYRRPLELTGVYHLGLRWF